MMQVKKENPARDITEAIERCRQTGEEFCVTCGAGMGFPALTTHVDAPIRYKGGAYYTEGCGQTCANCAIELSERKLGFL